MQRPGTRVGRSGRASRTGASAARAAPGRRSTDDEVDRAPAPVSIFPAPAATTPPAVDDGTSLRSHSNQIALRARSLFGQVQDLRKLCEQEHLRLAASLEALVGQSRQLERDVAALGALAEDLQSGATVSSRSDLAEAVPPADLELDSVAGLEVRCLGGFEVRFGGRLLDLGSSRNGRRIFKYLLVRAPHRRASKEVLAELFWPETTAERAMPSLQSAVHQLRRAMGRSDPDLAIQPAIVYADGHYGMNPELWIRCDLDYFRARLIEARSHEARGDVEAARRCYRLAQAAYGGELLPEERYEEWITGERTSLEADQLTVLTRLIQLSLEQGVYQEGIRMGRKLLEFDSTREDIHRDLMRCYSRIGQRSEAIHQYRRCCQALLADLDVQPEAETSALFERLMKGEVI